MQRCNPVSRAEFFLSDNTWFDLRDLKGTIKISRFFYYQIIYDKKTNDWANHLSENGKYFKFKMYYDFVE